MPSVNVNARYIVATALIVVLLAIFFAAVGLCVKYSPDRKQENSVSDFRSFEPTSRLQGLFCPQYDFSTTTEDCECISNSDPSFEIYSLENFDKSKNYYTTQSLSLLDTRALKPQDNYIIPLHEVLVGTYWTISVCVRWMNNKDIMLGNTVNTYMMIIQGSQNLTAVQQDLRPGRSVDKICAGRCMNSSEITNAGFCQVLPADNTLPALYGKASTLDDYFFLIYHPGKKGTVVVSTLIKSYRQHRDIVAMGGRKIENSKVCILSLQQTIKVNLLKSTFEHRLQSQSPRSQLYNVPTSYYKHNAFISFQPQAGIKKYMRPNKVEYLSRKCVAYLHQSMNMLVDNFFKVVKKVKNELSWKKCIFKQLIDLGGGGGGGRCLYADCFICLSNRVFFIDTLTSNLNHCVSPAYCQPNIKKVNTNLWWLSYLNCYMGMFGVYSFRYLIS